MVGWKTAFWRPIGHLQGSIQQVSISFYWPIETIETIEIDRCTSLVSRIEKANARREREDTDFEAADPFRARWHGRLIEAIFQFYLRRSSIYIHHWNTNRLYTCLNKLAWGFLVPACSTNTLTIHDWAFCLLIVFFLYSEMLELCDLIYDWITRMEQHAGRPHLFRARATMKWK